MSAVTIFKNFNEPVEDKSLIVILKNIQEGKYKTEIDLLRQLIAQGKKPDADDLKKLLPAFTASARFKGGRKLEFLIHYSGYIILDIDKLNLEDMQPLFQKIISIAYTMGCFESPGGRGYKIIVQTNANDVSQHSLAYKQVSEYYEQQLKVKIDQSGKDVTRLCFMSYDPQAYRTVDHAIFELKENLQSENPSLKENSSAASLLPLEKVPKADEDGEGPEVRSTSELFQQCVEFTNQKLKFETDNRNNYVYLLASNCNRAGIPQDDALAYILQDFNFDTKEVIASVKSAYNHHTNEHAKFAKRANGANVQSNHADHPEEDYLKTTPTIPQSVYDTLPFIFKEGARVFTDPRKRDVFFTGALAIISGCLPNVTGIYFHERVHPHLYTFTIAPAASGKGVLKHAKKLADKLHQQILSASRKSKKDFDSEMTEYKNTLKQRKKGDPAPEQPEEPPFKILFIPADCSQARMVDHLAQNEGRGIICETEADTMSGAKKQEWGDYSTILRAAFHHEKISFSRKTNNEFIEIIDPQVAVALTGTPAQAPRLISSAEDGLFTRFMFYAFKVEQVWQDPSPNANPIIYNDHFDALADTVMQYIQILEQSPTNVELNNYQWQTLNTTFASILSEVKIFTSEEATGIVYRLGLIVFRMCMIFSALRKCENAECTPTLICSDEDFNTAIELAKIYLQHSLLMFNNLPKQHESSVFKGGDSKQKFFDALPNEFTRQQAVELGKKFKLSASTIDHNILTPLIPTYLTRLKSGSYQKTNQ